MSGAYLPDAALLAGIEAGDELAVRAVIRRLVTHEPRLSTSTASGGRSP
ncbi:MAG TPA: hypothetical protein VFE40_13425 [Jatrophihabitantaceae bacterium]|nr:hypothetical protein [Jatrophihabitantaceae bacterium]